MIELIHDPFGLRDSGEELVVDSPVTRQKAYAVIDTLLREKQGEKTSLTVAVASAYWRQFKSAYKDFPHVSLKEVAPSSLLVERLQRSIPDWLDDRLIHDLGLDVNERTMPANESWPRWVVESFFFELDCATYTAWARSAYECETFKRPFPEEITDFLFSRIRLLLKEAPLDDAVVDQVMRILKEFSTIHQIVETMLVSPAVCPLLDQRPISTLTFDRLLAKKLPLVFPLPDVLHRKISKLFCNELKNQRIDGKPLSGVVLLLNAGWDNVSDELAVWLQQNPSGLSTKAAHHLQQIPVREEGTRLREFATLFAPAEPPGKVWSGLPDLHVWNREYSTYLRSVFSRRQLPESWDLDPAKRFTEWMQTESVTLYNDLENSFIKVSRSVRDALSRKQTVILCVLDAFAYHLEDILTKHFSEELAHQPTSHESIFAPVPTITEVAKMSVATGFPPSQCPSSWESALCQAYSLKPDELLLAMEWRDIGRVQPKGNHRLIVYLDNRIDDALKSQRNYSALREKVDDFSTDMAKRIRRWVEDLDHVQGQKPTVFVTADHGFTFAPPPDKGGTTIETIGHHRCTPVDDGATLRAPSHLARLDKDDYHLPVSYLAATKRGATQETISGLVMQHGGLLPEEVLVPLIRWFGSEQAIYFAEVSFLKKAEMVAGKWRLVVQIKNRSGMQINQMQLSLCLSGQKITTKSAPKLRADEERSLEFTLLPDFNAADDAEELTIVIHQTVAGRDAPKQSIKVGVYRVLMQADGEFEEMF